MRYYPILQPFSRDKKQQNLLQQEVNKTTSVVVAIIGVVDSDEVQANCRNDCMKMVEVLLANKVFIVEKVENLIIENLVLEIIIYRIIEKN